MAGMVFYQISAAEVKELKKSPQKLSSLIKNKDRPKIDIGEAGFQIDLILSYIQEKINEPALADAIGGGNLIGNDNYLIKDHLAKEVKEITAALKKVTKDDFIEACMVIGASADDMEDLAWKPLISLTEFYTDASKKRKAIIETIY